MAAGKGNAPVRSVGFCMLSMTGGSSIMASEIARRLRARDVRVVSCHCASDVGSTPDTTSLSKEFGFHVQRNLDVDRFFAGGLDVCSQVLAWHRRSEFEVLHVHSLPVFGLAAFHLKQLRGVPYVVTFHGSDVLDTTITAQNHAMMSAILAEAAAVTCVSSHLADELERTFPDLPRAQVVHNFLRSEFEGVDQSPLDRASPRFLHVSSLRSVKRPELLIESFRHVCGVRPDARLRLVTTREGVIRAHDLVAEVGRGMPIDVVEGTDASRLLEEYSRATAFVLTSRFESFGLVILEALAHGVPVVAPAVGGVREVLGEEWPLLVRDTAEPSAFARAMLAAISSDGRPRLADAGAAVLRRFDGSRQIDRYMDLYEGALRPPS